MFNFLSNELKEYMNKIWILQNVADFADFRGFWENPCKQGRIFNRKVNQN